MAIPFDPDNLVNRPYQSPDPTEEMDAETLNNQARQFARFSTRLEARLSPVPEHAGHYRLSLPDSMLGLAVIDVSEGGLGLSTGIFVPKNLQVIVRITGVPVIDENGTQEVTVRAVVRRCVLTDHRPTYQVGLQFVDRFGDQEQTLLRSVVHPSRSDVAESAQTTGEFEQPEK